MMIIDSVTHISCMKTLLTDINHTLFQESSLEPPVPECGGRGSAPRPGRLGLGARPLVLLPQGAPRDVRPRPPGGQWSPGPGQAALAHLADGGPGPQHQPIQPGALHQPQPSVPWPALGPYQGQNVSSGGWWCLLNPWCINTIVEFIKMFKLSVWKVRQINLDELQLKQCCLDVWPKIWKYFEIGSNRNNR